MRAHFCSTSKAVPVALAGFASMALLALVCFRKRLPKPCKGKEPEEPYETDSDSEPGLEEKEKGDIPTVMAYKVEPVDSPYPSDPKHATVVCMPDKLGSVEASFRIANDHSL